MENTVVMIDKDTKHGIQVYCVIHTDLTISQVEEIIQAVKDEFEHEANEWFVSDIVEGLENNGCECEIADYWVIGV